MTALLPVKRGEGPPEYGIQVNDVDGGELCTEWFYSKEERDKSYDRRTGGTNNMIYKDVTHALSSRDDETAIPIYFESLNALETSLRTRARQKGIEDILEKLDRADRARVLGFNVVEIDSDHWLGRAISFLHDNTDGLASEVVEALNDEIFCNSKTYALREVFSQIDLHTEAGDTSSRA